MKKIALFILVVVCHACYGQDQAKYNEWTKKAMDFYYAKQYQQSADAFSRAFEALGWKGQPDDRYNAACWWAQAGNKDSAFFQLDRIATKSNYSDLGHMTTDEDLMSLHSDSRWPEVCAIVKQNKDKIEAHWNKPLAAELDTIFQNDQQSRMQIEGVQQKYGDQSAEMKNLWKTISWYDSVDLVKVVAILDQYGWPGSALVGGQNNEAIFLVIQHADIHTQDKYLPMMREAVKNHKASSADLALLEDRTALGHGKKQIYGSQISSDAAGSYLAPMEDPDNVDKRRAEVGLDPLAGYLNYFHMTWNVEDYKKQLPEIEKREAAINKH